VRRHVKVENAQDIDGLLATFKAPRYEFAACDLVFGWSGAVIARFLLHDRCGAPLDGGTLIAYPG
jgi:hypothetical protein